MGPRPARTHSVLAVGPNGPAIPAQPATAAGAAMIAILENCCDVSFPQQHFGNIARRREGDELTGAYDEENYSSYAGPGGGCCEVGNGR
jgi:hypothetical protein